jgi:hypothetical protein
MVTGLVLANLETPHPGIAQRLAFSPDGARLAVSYGNGQVHPWDLRLLRARLAELRLDWDAPPYPQSEGLAGSDVTALPTPTDCPAAGW